MKVFLRFYDDHEEDVTVTCDWVYIGPDYISSFACPDDGIFPYVVKCYYVHDKEYLKIFKDVLDVEVI